MGITSIPSDSSAATPAPFSPGLAVAESGGSYTSYDTVQAAIDATDGLVTVGPGTYNEVLETGRAIDLVVIGAGRATLINGGSTLDDTFDIQGSIASFTLRDFAIQGDSNLSGGHENIKIDGVSEGLIQNVFFEGVDRHCVQIVNAFDVSVESCTFNSVGVYAVDITSGSDDVVVSNNRFRSGGTNRAVSTGNNCERVIISNNMVEDGGQEDIFIMAGQRGVCSNNTIHDAAIDAIEVQSTGEHCVVEGNVIDNPGATGIDVGADNCTVSNNTVWSAGSESYLVDGQNCVLSGNISAASAGEDFVVFNAIGLQAAGNSPPVQTGLEDFERDGFLAEYVGGTADATVTHETIVGNRALRLNDVASADSTVLYDTPGDRTVVSGNVYEYYTYINNDGGGEAFATFHFFASGTGFGTLNAYQLQVSVGTTKSLSFQRVTGGTENALASTTISSLAPDTWYKVRLSPVGGGTLEARIYEVADDTAALGTVSYDTSADGTQYTSGTFGFGIDNASYVNVGLLRRVAAL